MFRTIQINKYIFDRCIDLAYILLDKNKLNLAATFSKDIAYFAANNITGYYSSWRLERLLFLISKKTNFKSGNVFDTLIFNDKEVVNLEILHVVTQVYKTGGHTKLLKNWIDIDTINNHSVVSTSMEFGDLKRVMSFHELSEVKKYYLTGTLINKSVQLRTLASKFDKIILHIHQYDVIPNLSFSDFKHKKNIIFLNHADHIFWLGVSIFNVLAQIRENNIELDILRRGVNNCQLYLPIPLKDLEIKNKSSKVILKKELNLSEDSIVLLSVASAYKFKPIDNKNYFSDIIEILNLNKKLILFVIGVKGNENFTIKHPQIKYLGVVRNIEKYELIADVYIENYPLASFTSMLQFMKKQIPVHLMYEPNDSIRFFSKDNEQFKYSKNKLEWKKRLLNLIKNKNEIRKKIIVNQNNYLKQNNSSAAWLVRLNIIYEAKDEVNIFKKNLFFNSEEEFFLSNYMSKKNKFSFKPLLFSLNFIEFFKFIKLFYYLSILKVESKKKKVL
ncbi:MAG: hypothetical protein ACI9D4_002531 [Polaribacter sp.]|jgi:hypothetical protein